jgi:hypothetical protein
VTGSDATPDPPDGRWELRHTWRRQLPLTAVLAVVAAGMLLVALDHWVVGTDVFAAGLGCAAVIRASLSRRQAGLLAVRSQWFDVALLAGAAISMVTISTSLR